jgi:fibronectin type 3 domain-containing protein
MLISFASADTIKIAWDANTEEDLAGYKVYYGTSTGNYGTPIELGKVTEYDITGLNSNTVYYIALTAYDSVNNESEKSDELHVLLSPADIDAPPIPTNLIISQIGKEFRMLEVA